MNIKVSKNYVKKGDSVSKVKYYFEIPNSPDLSDEREIFVRVFQKEGNVALEVIANIQNHETSYKKSVVIKENVMLETMLPRYDDTNNLVLIEFQVTEVKEKSFQIH